MCVTRLTVKEQSAKVEGRLEFETTYRGSGEPARDGLSRQERPQSCGYALTSAGLYRLAARQESPEDLRQRCWRLESSHRTAVSAPPQFPSAQVSAAK